MDPEELRQEARLALAWWKRNQDSRDELIRAAHGLGIQIKEISQLSGLSRTTIYKILGIQEGGQQ